MSRLEDIARSTPRKPEHISFIGGPHHGHSLPEDAHRLERFIDLPYEPDPPRLVQEEGWPTSTVFEMARYELMTFRYQVMPGEKMRHRHFYVRTGLKTELSTKLAYDFIMSGR